MVELASHEGAVALVLESTFTSLPDVADAKFPLSPPGALMRNQFDSLSKISDYDGPVFIVHGEEDQLVPIAQAKSLYAGVKGPKSFVKIAGAGHNWDANLEFIAALDQFLARLPAAMTQMPRGTEAIPVD